MRGIGHRFEGFEGWQRGAYDTCQRTVHLFSIYKRSLFQAIVLKDSPAEEKAVSIKMYNHILKKLFKVRIYKMALMTEADF